MAEKERITDPTQGSNEPGKETPATRGSGMPAGTDTQTRMAALSAQQKKEEEEGVDPSKPKQGDFPVGEDELSRNQPRNIDPGFHSPE